MASQLVYTSAAKLLDAGRSGFGTVARARTISPLVVSAIERVSQFANQRGTDRSRMIFVHRRIIAGNHRCHVLSRICDAGADYTGRTNHIAHHLVLSAEEAARAAAAGITPADVLRQFAWLDRWDEPARFFGPDEEVAVENFRPTAGREAWTRLTGQPTHARLLAWDGAPRTGVLLVPRAAEPLPLLAEALREFGPQAWSRTFTTGLETTDELSDLDWIVTTPDAFPEIQGRCGARATLDLSQPATLPVPPEAVAAVVEPPPSARTDQGTTGPTVRAQVVRLGGTAPAPAKSRPLVRPAPPKQVGAWLVAGGAAVVILVVLAVATWKTLRPAAVPPSVTPVAKLTDSQQDAVGALIEAGVSNDDAEAIAIKSAGQARAWATFIARFLGEIKAGKGSPDLRKLPRPPAAREPAGVPAWLTGLTAARNDLAEFSTARPGSNLSVRLAALRQIHGQLKSAARDLAPGLSPDACDWFDSTLVADEIERYRQAVGPGGLETLLDQLQTAATEGQFNRDDLPARHEVLLGFAGKHLGFSSAQSAQFADDGTVPQDLRLKLRAANSAGRPAPAAGSDAAALKPMVAPDLAATKPLEVIVVSRAQLEQGVAVGLLAQIMKANHAPGTVQLKLDRLAVFMTPSDPGNETTQLFLADDKTFYCRTKLKDDRAPRFYPDGRLALRGGPALKAAKLRFEAHEATVAVNEPGDNWLREDLRFETKPAGDAAMLAGELAEWLKAVDLRDPAGGPLDLQLVPPSPELLVTSDPAGWRLALRPQGPPRLVFSKIQAEDLAKALKDFVAKGGLSSGSRGAKTQAANERKKALEVLQQRLCVALGGALLSKELKLLDESAIDIKQLQNIRTLVAETYRLGGAAAPPNGLTSAGTLRNIEEALGRDRLDAELPKLGKKVSWEALADDKASTEWIRESILAILQETRPPESVATLAGELGKLTGITVSTRAGRHLFKASRK